MPYRNYYFLPFLFIIFLILCSTVNAGTRSNGLIITPFAGGYIFEGNESYKDAPLYGLGIGYRLNKYWSAELILSYADLEIDSCNDNDLNCEDQPINGYGAYLDVTYDILPDFVCIPYMTLGMGAMAYDYDKDNDDNLYDIHNKSASVFHYGAGIRYELTSYIDIRADVRHELSFDASSKLNEDYDLFNNMIATLGISFAFDKSKKAAFQPQPKQMRQIVNDDHDQDGVPNSIDKCPNTVPKVSVNALGCPYDTDKDGVYDYQDQCPGTLPGDTVDMFGCSKDSDSDGIMDTHDKCSHTPANVAVGPDGCPLDSDMDGINDDSDKCPNTKAGTIVDATGCEKPKNKRIHLKLKIEFESGKADVATHTLDKIKEVAEVMDQYPGSTAVIEAHTDSSGGAAYNLKLSQKRANMVVYYLSKYFGIDRSRLRAVGYGETRPIADNRTKAGRKKNRRAVAIITAMQPGLR